MDTNAMSYFVYKDDISPFNFIVHTDHMSKLLATDWIEISNAEYLVLAKKKRTPVFLIVDGKMIREEPL